MKIRAEELTKDLYKPGEVGDLIGVTNKTIRNYTIKGYLDEVWTPTGRRLIPRESLIKYLKEHDMYDDSGDERKDVIYARVSTHKQKQGGYLDRQINELIKFVVDKNPKDLEIIDDVGSGLNDNRKGFVKLINMILNNEVKRVFVLYKDRLTRFGFNIIEQICNNKQVEIIVVSDVLTNKTLEEELAEDIISIIHSFSGKLYGMRRKVKEEVSKELTDGGD